MPAAPQIPSPPTTANARGRVGLTRRQRDTISYLADNPDASYVEIKAALGVKSNESIRRLLGALEERGYIRRLPNRARAIEVLATEPSRPQSGFAIIYTPEDLAARAEAKRQRWAREAA